MKSPCVRLRSRLTGVVVLLALASGLSACLPLHAQTADDTVIDTSTTSFNKALHVSDWDDIIAISTHQLEQSPPIPDHDARLFRYYQGNAYAHIGQLDEAAADFESLIATAPVPDIVAQNELDSVKRQIALRPPLRRDVSIDGQVRFTIFADANDLALQKVVDLAPVAANAVRSLLGKPPRRTVIFLFGSAERQKAFSEVRWPNSEPFNKTAWARGGADGVFMWVGRQGQKYSVDPLSSYFRLGVSHEYMHVNVLRTLAARASLPIWLNEGVANVAGCHAAPDQSAWLAHQFRSAVEHQTVMTLDDLNKSHFYEVAYAVGAAERSEYPYAQASSMTTFLLLGRKEAVIGDLLRTMRQTGDFESAFQQTFGESVKDFYGEWQAYALPKKAAAR